MADILVEIDEWVGVIINVVDKLSIAENTVIVVMGDNGPFMQYTGASGQFAGMIKRHMAFEK
ncbi:MAG: hypothetical protein ACC648_06990 [Thiohalobacterales bacterium]